MAAITKWREAYVVLPEEVQEWAGMFSSTGYSRDFDVSLVQLNDEGEIFENIARIIEARAEDL
jgi:hypothetical protein